MSEDNIIKDAMGIAIKEAKTSLKRGNSGFGAVLINNGQIAVRAHDTDKTDQDPTSHAELNVIKCAAKTFGTNLKGSILVSTHEPCPMCSTAALWAGIDEVAYGYSIKDAIKQGRRRIDISIKEIYDRSSEKIIIHDNVLSQECALLYNFSVRKNVEFLRNTNMLELEKLAHRICENRKKWFKENYSCSPSCEGDLLLQAYRLFLKKLGLTEKEAPIVKREDRKLVIHSKNFCPTLEACKILDLDTRIICKRLTEGPTNDLLRLLNPKLCFRRNYMKLRPFSEYCEEFIILDQDN